MKKLKRHEPHDLHPCVYVCIADDVAELEAALAEAVALMRFMCSEQCIEHDRDLARSRMRTFLDKHGGESDK